MQAKSATRAGCLGALLIGAAFAATAEETPKQGGTLNYVIPADAPPSFDAHRETTFATIHSAAPFYSVLIRVDPNNPSSTTDFAKQRAMMRDFEKYVIDDQAHQIWVLWWYRIVPYRSYVKGWKISASHYLNQDLATIWLDK